MYYFKAPLDNHAKTVFQNEVKAGQMVVIPTDTVYGIGADPFNKLAVDALLQAKGRGREYPSPVLVADIAQVREVALEIPTLARQFMEVFWPGALTIVLPARPELGWDLGITGGTVALRIPNQDDTRELLAATGPLAVTSANLHSQPPAMTCTEARNYFGPKVKVYIDGGECRTQKPSTIIKCISGGGYELIRCGAVSQKRLDNIVGM